MLAGCSDEEALGKESFAEDNDPLYDENHHHRSIWNLFHETHEHKVYPFKNETFNNYLCIFLVQRAQFNIFLLKLIVAG